MKRLNYFDIGEIPLKECNEMNIPVNCFISEPEEDIYWHWCAGNFMPRKCRADEGMYEIRAKTKKDILEAINKYVIPLYKIALKKLKETGELYYWE